jgi:acetyl-CoA carboxylase carboxyl transferase subunit beta
MALFGKSNYTFIKVKRKEIPVGVWTKCPGCESPAYSKELKNNLNVCPKCGFHLGLTARERVEHIMDEGSFVEMDAKMTSADPFISKALKRIWIKLKQIKKKQTWSMPSSLAKARLKGIKLFCV